MKKLLQIYYRISFKTKLLLSYIVLIIIPITVGWILINSNFINLLRNNSLMLITQRMNEKVSNINMELTNIEMTAYQLSSNMTLSRFLADEHEDYSYQFFDTLTSSIYPMFSWVKTANPIISDAYIFTKNATLPNAYLFRHAINYENTYWFKDVQNHTFLGSPYWENLHLSRNYNGTLYTSSQSNNYVYSLFYIINPTSSNNTAYLELIINPKQLFNSVISSPIGKNGFFAIINSKGFIISGNETPLLSSIVTDNKLQSALSESSESISFKYDQSTYYVGFQYIEKLDSYLLSIIPEKEITELFEKPRNHYIISICITFILLLFLAFALGNAIHKKITKISKAIYQFQEGNFDTSIEVKGMDELDKLSMDFNSMSAKINELVNKVYKAEIAQKQDEIFALQSQINPHFIYNTLESIKMMAELHDEEDISDCITALGNLLRQNNTIGDHLITIESELENLSDYIKIQNLTYNNRIRITFNISQEIMKYKTLRLVLQPLAENSIVHGLGDNMEYINILVQGYKSGNDILFTIQDDGCGIDSDRLDEITSILNSDPKDHPSSKNGIGLFNVNRRIKLFFGIDYGLSIKSTEGTSTAITIKLPATQ